MGYGCWICGSGRSGPRWRAAGWLSGVGQVRAVWAYCGGDAARRWRYSVGAPPSACRARCGGSTTATTSPVLRSTRHTSRPCTSATSATVASDGDEVGRAATPAHASECPRARETARAECGPLSRAARTARPIGTRLLMPPVYPGQTRARICTCGQMWACGGYVETPSLDLWQAGAYGKLQLVAALDARPGSRGGDSNGRDYGLSAGRSGGARRAARGRLAFPSAASSAEGARLPEVMRCAQLFAAPAGGCDCWAEACKKIWASSAGTLEAPGTPQNRC